MGTEKKDLASIIEAITSMKSATSEKLTELQTEQKSAITALGKRIENLEGQPNSEADKIVNEFKSKLENLEKEIKTAQGNLKDIAAHEQTFIAEKVASPFGEYKSFGEYVAYSDNRKLRGAGEASFVIRLNNANMSPEERAKRPLEIKSALTDSFYNPATNTWVNMGNNSGVISPPVQEAYFRPQIFNYLPQVTTDLTIIQTIVEKGFSGMVAMITADAIVGATTIQVATTGGFFEGQEVIVGGVTTKISSPNGINAVANTITLENGIASAVTAGEDEIKSSIVGGTPLAMQKPQFDYGVELEETNFITIAGMITIPNQMYNNNSYLRDLVDRVLKQRSDDSLAYQAMFGTGQTGRALKGLATNANRQILKHSDFATLSKIDLLRKAKTMASRVGVMPQIALMPSDILEDVETAKSAGSKDYIFGGPTVCGTAFKVWCMDPVVDMNFSGNSAFVLPVQKTATLFNRGNWSLRVSEHHGYNFSENLTTLRYENDFALENRKPNAVVEVVFDV